MTGTKSRRVGRLGYTGSNYGTDGLYFDIECNMTIDASVDVTAAWTQSCVTRHRQRVWHGMQRDNRRTEIRAFCLAMHQFYVFNKPVMCIFRVVLRCKNVTNTSLMCLSSTRPLMYLLHAVYVAKTPQCIRFTSFCDASSTMRQQLWHRRRALWHGMWQ